RRCRSERKNPSVFRGASPRRTPYRLTRSPPRRLAPFAWLARCRSLAPVSASGSECSLFSIVSDRLSAIAAPRLPRPGAEDLGRFCDTGAEDAERTPERPAARQRQLRGGVADLRIAVRVGRQPFPVAEQVAPRAVEHLPHHALRVDRIPEAVV